MGIHFGRAWDGVVNTGRTVVDGTQQLGREAVEHGQGILGQGQDLFEGAVDTVQGVAARRSDDVAHDGHLVYPDGTTQPPGAPLRREEGKPLILHVNGVNTDVAAQTSAISDLEERTGAQVIGIHNATEGAVYDLAQASQDSFGKGENAAVARWRTSSSPSSRPAGRST